MNRGQNLLALAGLSMLLLAGCAAEPIDYDLQGEFARFKQESVEGLLASNHISQEDLDSALVLMRGTLADYKQASDPPKNAFAILCAFAICREKELELEINRSNLSKVSGWLIEGLNDIEKIPEAAEYYRRFGEDSDTFNYFRPIVRHHIPDSP